MDYEAIRHFFEERIKYKPGWKFQVWRSSLSDRIEIILRTAPTPDACTYGTPNEKSLDPLTLVQHVYHGALREEDHCRHFAQDMIRRMELHEIDEWLKLDRRHVKDPHPELKEPRRSVA